MDELFNQTIRAIIRGKHLSAKEINDEYFYITGRNIANNTEEIEYYISKITNIRRYGQYFFLNKRFKTNN